MLAGRELVALGQHGPYDVEGRLARGHDTRDQQVYRHSLHRLQTSAALHAYLDKHHTSTSQPEG